MKVLITGSNGQVGWELQRTAPDHVQVAAFASAQLDIRDGAQVQNRIGEVAPDVIINCAAYTAVDKAEQERSVAYAVNGEGARQIARAARAVGARLIHLSTDFVFDGRKSTPYLPGDPANPTGVYGASKLAGELAVETESQGEALIVRTAWVYSAHGHNFVKTMLRLMQEKPQLGVVADQVGSPTWAKGLAQALWRALAIRDMKGIHHWTDAGVASWYDFAVAIQEEALTLGMLKSAIPIRPLRTDEYPTPAMRPAYSVLEKSATWQALNHAAVHWRAHLREALSELKGQR